MNINTSYSTLPHLIADLEDPVKAAEQYFVSSIRRRKIEHFDERDIPDPKVRIEIAKIYMRELRSEMAQYIPIFNIQDQQALVEMAQFCAQHCPVTTAQHIQKFGIQDPEVRFQIAKLCAERSRGTIARYIQNFDILEESKRIEIAIICAQQNGTETAENISRFAILNQQALLEIAKLCIQQNYEMVIYYIHNFALQNQKRFEIAQFCAQENASLTAQYMEEFGIQEEWERIEIAKLCARRDGSATASHIENFAIQDESARVEIAKLCVQQNSWGLIERIKTFRIRSQQALIEIATLCARQNGKATAMNIQSFAIEDPYALIEIAKLCAQENGLETAKYIQNFGIQEERTLIEVFVLAANQNPISLKYLPDKNNPLQTIIDNLHSQSLSVLLGALTNAIGRHMPATNISPIVKALETIENPEEQLKALSVATAALFIWQNTLTQSQMEWLSEQGLFEAIFLLPAPHLRLGLIHSTKTMVIERHFFEQISAWKGNALLKLPLTCLLSQEIALLQKINPHTLKDSKNLIAVLETLELFYRDTILSPAEKARVAIALDKGSFLDRSRDLLIILQCKQSHLLQRDDELDLPRLAQEAFRSILPLSEPIANFSELYEQTFGSYQQRDALVLYAANLASLNDPTVMQALSEHVTFVLTGTYLKQRYATERNPHLKMIRDRVPTIAEKWKSNSAHIPLEELLIVDNADSASIPQSMREWLTQKIVIDRHMDLPFLIDYLHAETEEAQKKVYDTLTMRKLTTKGPEAGILSLQIKCCLLAKSDSLEKTVNLLIEIEQLPFASLFKEDITAKIRSLSDNLKIEGLYGIDTDDAQDMILCGTTIRGSCQRIGGDPHLNKGLLGYLHHGQTRLLAIKNKQGHLIARALLRLLWDGEKPVLFLERLYSNIDDVRLGKAIISLAAKRAQQLGCPLTAASSTGIPYGKSIYSLGGPSPYEYVDGAHGICKKGEFRINNAQLL